VSGIILRRNTEYLHTLHWDGLYNDLREAQTILYDITYIHNLLVTFNQKSNKMISMLYVYNKKEAIKLLWKVLINRQEKQD
jgi:hypothetical protein